MNFLQRSLQCSKWPGCTYAMPSWIHHWGLTPSVVKSRNSLMLFKSCCFRKHTAAATLTSLRTFETAYNVKTSTFSSDPSTAAFANTSALILRSPDISYIIEES